jgi:hypothetical protein
MADLFNFWDSTEQPAPTDAYGQMNQEQFAWDSGYAQARTTAAPADVSWTGLTDLPAFARAAVSVAQTGFGLSLAKEQILAQRDIGKASLQANIARAQSDALIARYQGAAQVSAAQRAAMYPNGVPFGTTRQDQLMIAIGIAGLFLAYLQIK